jgi:hypothetical protein
MIGIIAASTEHPVVEEFFELFKTPWEFYETGRHYDVVLCAGELPPAENTTGLILVYAGHELDWDSTVGIEVVAEKESPCFLASNGDGIPLYGERVRFKTVNPAILVDEQGCSAILHRADGQVRILRIGYNLFAEIRRLLTSGQPAANAAIPTLELHIALLRNLIAAGGTVVTEIPPVPAGYRFIACLTHDIDHPLIRKHGCDHTVLGFLYRATIGSLSGLLRGRRTSGEVLRNLAAVLKLPFVYAGLVQDFWGTFDRYLQLEKGHKSSFFVIPFKDRPGLKASGKAPRRRAARYGVSDIASQVSTLRAAGSEIGVHGIDAWLDSAAARSELEEIRKVSGTREAGVRMHWLYFGEHSHAILEDAGAEYDSTVGYNETVGYRAGTVQVYKPLNTTRLLELPLHVMDTALFYPAYLHLAPREAVMRVKQIIENAVRFGGCITINWHDRSIAPERCWDGVYSTLLEELERQGAWFGNAAETVAWFRKRRKARFDTSTGKGLEKSPVALLGDVEDGLPDLEFRVVRQAKEQAISCPA